MAESDVKVSAALPSTAGSLAQSPARSVFAPGECGEKPDAALPTYADLVEEIEKLREAVAVRDAFLAVAAHELRNPMTPIVGRVERLRRLLKKPDFRPETLERRSGTRGVPSSSAATRSASVAMDQGVLGSVHSGQCLRLTEPLAATGHLVRTKYRQAARQWSGLFLSFRCRTRATSGVCPRSLGPSDGLALSFRGGEHMVSVILHDVLIDPVTLRSAFRTCLGTDVRHLFSFASMQLAM